MPTLYDIVQLCSRTSKSTKPLPMGWKRFMISSNLSESNLENLGYYGEAFVHYKNKEVLIAHRGTQLKGLNVKFSTIAATSNLLSDSILASKLLPFETELAFNFTESVLKHSSKWSEEFHHIQIGHSLGGFHAHLCGYKFGHFVIAIDPPGSANQLRTTEIDKKQLCRHFSFLNDPNFVNSTNDHIGYVFQLAENIHQVDVVNKSLATIHKHYLKYLEGRLSNDGSDPLKDFPKLLSTKNSGLVEYTKLFSGIYKLINFPDFDESKEIIPELSSNDVSKNKLSGETQKPKLNYKLLHKANRSYYTMNSELKPSREIDQSMWAVSHINTGSIWSGHSMIVVEGVLLTRSSVSEHFEGVPKLFVGYYHLILPSPDKNYGIVLSQEYEFHRYKKYYNPNKTRIWLRTKHSVCMMIEKIKEDLGKPIPYHFAGGNSLFYSDDDKYNCTRWANEKLKLLDIDTTSKLDGKITKPVAHTS